MRRLRRHVDLSPCLPVSLRSMNRDLSVAAAFGRIALAAILAATLAACVADKMDAEDSQQMAAAAAPQPRRATYDCGEDGRVTVENLSTAVRLVEPDGESYNLPASPPTQTSRFGGDGMALVVEDREALWMKAGSEPVTCRR